ncbi:hypothetical protein GCM10009641_86100 [Mycobacterium cookii]
MLSALAGASWVRARVAASARVAEPRMVVRMVLFPFSQVPPRAGVHSEDAATPPEVASDRIRA